MSEARWKAYISGKKYGPVDDETIRQWIAEHRVTATTQVWRPGMPKWLKAREVAEFSMYFDETVAAMPALGDDASEQDAAKKAEDAAANARAEADKAAAEAEAQAAEAQADAADATVDTAQAAAAQEEAADEQQDAPDASSASPKPVEAQTLAEGADAMYGDDDAPTVVQASPFADVENKQQDATIRVQPTEPEEKPAPEAKPAAAAQPAAAEAAPAPKPTAPRPGTITKPQPGLPIIPFFLALIALLPAASFGYLMAQGVIAAEGLGFYLMCGAVLGLVLIMIPPLFFSMAGLWLGLVGGLLALGCWVALVVAGAPGDLGAFLKLVFIDTFQGGPVGIAMGVLNWCTIVVGLLAILYFAFSGKYRARARA